MNFAGAETRALARRDPEIRTRAETTRLRSYHVEREARHSQPARFFQDSHGNPDSQPDRSAAALLRAVSADGQAAERARRFGAPVGFCLGLPDHRLPRHLAAGLRGLLDRQLGVQVRPPEGAAPPAHGLRALRGHGHHQSLPARRRALPEVRRLQQEHPRLLQQVRRPGEPATEVRPAGVRGARHDLFGAAQGDRAPDRLRQGRRDRQQDGPRHQGAGGLLRRHSADDAEWHLYCQRDRARDRLAVAPLAGRFLRDRQ